MRLLFLSLLLACRPDDGKPVDTGAPDTDAGDVDGDGYAAAEGDCDDADAAVHPGATETCDGVDDDCDGTIDTDATDASTWYADGDGDGHGGTSSTVACDAPDDFVATDDDCDDADPATFPGADEPCGDDVDRNCDGSPGNADADGDGAPACEDCDDADPTAFPGGIEVCDDADADEDCDGLADDADPSATGQTTRYVDADGDGYGADASPVSACDFSTGYAETAGDCDDASALAAPGLDEVCGDGLDGDCDGDPADCVFGGDYDAATRDLQLTGDAMGEYVGASVAVGDFDGDGSDDLVGGAPAWSGAATAAGAAFVWYGPVTASGTAAATSDATLTGATTDEYVGYSLAVGDHDGDGVDDLFVGAYLTSENAGAAYLAYGGARWAGEAGIAAGSDVAALTGENEGDYFGFGVASGGDLDGDGTEEIVAGAHAFDGSATWSGAAYVYYGSATRRAGSTEASAADATVEGTRFGESVGSAVAIVRDMDGDGLDELLVGAKGAASGGSTTGGAFLFLGDATPLSGAYAPSDADVRYYGTAGSDYAGEGVYDLTDVTGDGYADAGVYGSGHDAATFSVGGLWVFAGGAHLSTTAVATLEGVVLYEYFGGPACSPGDLDGDGTADLLVGAYGDDTATGNAGAAHLWYGPVSGTLDSSASDATFYGSPLQDGYFGQGLPAGAADVTGDGFDDVVVGARLDDTTERDGGAIYIWAGAGGI